VEADLTVTIGFPKAALLDDEAAAAVGRLAVVRLKELTRADGDTSKCLLAAPLLLPSLPRRPFDFHKGMAGRVALIAGSRGFLGAAILAASGALRAGAGLVTLCVKEDVYSIVAPMAPPEVMVRPIRKYREALEGTLDALAIGPGLGGGHDDDILEVISDASAPTVVDADALNALSRRGLDALRQGKAPRLLTPHPGEMARLAEHFPGWKPLGRVDLARAFCREFPHATLLLKGARTVIASEGKPTSFNSTGTPGMASGGMGDVLTGVCAALAAQGVDLHAAACLGAWLSGRAAEIAIATGTSSEESLGASDLLSHLGGAFQDLKQCAY
jgi:NAD(P)H-hydrate epimerase